MIIAGIFGFWEWLVVFVVLFIFIGSGMVRRMRLKNNHMTEKLDQLERLERLHREGSITEREFRRQKRKIMK